MYAKDVQWSVLRRRRVERGWRDHEARLPVTFLIITLDSSWGSTAPRPSEIRGVNSFCCGDMAGRKPSMNSIRIVESQGSRSQLVSVVEMTVIRARNFPRIEATFGGKRESFITITYGATTKETKTKRRSKKTKIIHIDRRTAVWDQRRDAL
ncbi:hypothetical protein H4582DRAFT_2063119 [Lactarius indigo]|nr:hypothetical protein H4582DRAFT_2063119 [Lactarius indigo]